MNLGEITRSSLYCDYRDEPCQIKGYKAPILLETTFLILNEIPSPNHDIYISGYNQVFNQDEIINENDYWVDYVHGLIYFHESKMGQKITIDEYFGLGNMLIDATRVVTKCDDKGNVIQVLEDLLEAYPNLIAKLEEAIVMCERMELNIEKLEELWTRISRTQNPSFTINKSQWILDSANNMYYYNLTHNCNSYNIIVTGYNQDTNISMGTIPFKTTGENTIKLYTTSPYNAKVIVNASYYHGFESLDTTVVQEVEDSRMGEGSLAVKISKMTNDINLLRTDLETDKKDLTKYKVTNKQNIDSINTSINTLNNKIYKTNELITTTKSELTELITTTKSELTQLISTSILEHDKNVTYAVGKPYISFTDSRNPSEILGFGTWEQVKGRTLVGVDTSDNDFKTVNKTGGSKTQTLTIEQLPQNVYADVPTNDGTRTKWVGDEQKANWCNRINWFRNNAPQESLSIMPPYVTCYIWIRIE